MHFQASELSTSDQIVCHVYKQIYSERTNYIVYLLAFNLLIDSLISP